MAKKIMLTRKCSIVILNYGREGCIKKCYFVIVNFHMTTTHGVAEEITC